jgi:hypothetical protein
MEPVAFDDGRVTDAGDAGAEDSQGDGISHSHASIVPDRDSPIIRKRIPRRQGKMMTMLKEKLRADLSVAMKARDEVRTRTLRMALTALTNEEVSGKQARELSDDEVVKVLQREAKKRREAAEAFTDAGRTEQAEAERAEGVVLDEYLPTQLDDAELATLVADAIAETGADGPRAMGQVMKVVTPKVAGRADGRRVSGEVKRQLAG